MVTSARTISVLQKKHTKSIGYSVRRCLMVPQLQPDVEMNQMMILILLVSLPLLLEELEERDAMQKQRKKLRFWSLYVFI